MKRLLPLIIIIIAVCAFTGTIKAQLYNTLLAQLQGVSVVDLGSDTYRISGNFFDPTSTTRGIDMQVGDVLWSPAIVSMDTCRRYVIDSFYVKLVGYVEFRIASAGQGTPSTANSVVMREYSNMGIVSVPVLGSDALRECISRHYSGQVDNISGGDGNGIISALPLGAVDIETDPFAYLSLTNLPLLNMSREQEYDVGTETGLYSSYEFILDTILFLYDVIRYKNTEDSTHEKSQMTITNDGSNNILSISNAYSVSEGFYDNPGNELAAYSIDIISDKSIASFSIEQSVTEGNISSQNELVMGPEEGFFAREYSEGDTSVELGIKLENDQVFIYRTFTEDDPAFSSQVEASYMHNGFYTWHSASYADGLSTEGSIEYTFDPESGNAPYINLTANSDGSLDNNDDPLYGSVEFNLYPNYTDNSAVWSVEFVRNEQNLVWEIEYDLNYFNWRIDNANDESETYLLLTNSDGQLGDQVSMAQATGQELKYARYANVESNSMEISTFGGSGDNAQISQIQTFVQVPGVDQLYWFAGMSDTLGVSYSLFFGKANETYAPNGGMYTRLGGDTYQLLPEGAPSFTLGDTTMLVWVGTGTDVAATRIPFTSGGSSDGDGIFTSSGTKSITASTSVSIGNRTLDFFRRSTDGADYRWGYSPTTNVVQIGVVDSINTWVLEQGGQKNSAWYYKEQYQHILTPDYTSNFIRYANIIDSTSAVSSYLPFTGFGTANYTPSNTNILQDRNQFVVRKQTGASTYSNRLIVDVANDEVELPTYGSGRSFTSATGLLGVDNNGITQRVDPSTYTANIFNTSSSFTASRTGQITSTNTLSIFNEDLVAATTDTIALVFGNNMPFGRYGAGFRISNDRDSGHDEFSFVGAYEDPDAAAEGTGNGVIIGYFDKSASTNNVYLAASNSAITLSTNAGSLVSSGTSWVFTDNRGTKVGLEYGGDYGSTFTARSLVDKGYVDQLSGKRVVTTTSTDGSGQLSIAHGISAYTPDWGQVSMGGSNDYTARVVSINGTNIVIEIRDAGGATVNSTSVTVYWEVGKAN